MPRFRTQAELDAYTRAQLSETQRVTFDELMATGTWKVNKSLSNGIKSICWLESKQGTHYVVAIDLEGKIQRPVKGKTGVSFNSRTLQRAY